MCLRCNSRTMKGTNRKKIVCSDTHWIIHDCCCFLLLLNIWNRVVGRIFRMLDLDFGCQVKGLCWQWQFWGWRIRLYFRKFGGSMNKNLPLICSTVFVATATKDILTLVCWSWLVPTYESQLCPSLSNSM